MNLPAYQLDWREGESQWDPANAVVAIDPGYEQSAVVCYVHDDKQSPIRYREILPNDKVRQELLAQDPRAGTLLIEKIESFGMSVGKTVFETVFWSGRFAEAWESWGGRLDRVPRRTVKMHLCNSMRAKDANIRQALLDRWGGTQKLAVGTKKYPGPLYGVSKDLWAALAVAVTWCEQQEQEQAIAAGAHPPF